MDINNENTINSLTSLRNNLYDSIPTGKSHGFEFLKVIKEHLEKLDNMIENIKLLDSFPTRDNYVPFSRRQLCAKIASIAKGQDNHEDALNRILEQVEPLDGSDYNNFVLIECDSPKSAKALIAYFKSNIENELFCLWEFEQNEGNKSPAYPKQLQYNESWNYIKGIYD